MKSSNPTYGRNAIARLASSDVKDGTVMSLQGVAKKAFVLLVVVLISAAYTWRTAALHGVDAITGPAVLGCIGGLVLGIATIFVPSMAPISAPLYAVLEGLAIGAISYWTNVRYHGIPLQAAVATFGITAVCFGLFASGRIEVSESFAEKVAIGIIGLLVVYLLRFTLVLAGVPLGTTMNQGVFGFVVNAASITLAVMCLFVDFAEIDSARKEKLSAKTEWYFAFSVLVTIIWMYLAILRMMRRLRR